MMHLDESLSFAKQHQSRQSSRIAKSVSENIAHTYQVQIGIILMALRWFTMNYNFYALTMIQAIM